jgi:hypothetical protein
MGGLAIYLFVIHLCGNIVNISNCLRDTMRTSPLVNATRCEHIANALSVSCGASLLHAAPATYIQVDPQADAVYCSSWIFTIVPISLLRLCVD